MKMVQAGRDQGIDVQLSDDFVLNWSRLGWINNEFMQRRAIELLALGACLVLWRKYREFNGFVLEVSRLAPGSWFYKLNVARITLRKIGIYEIVRRFSSDEQVVLLDNEGVLQGSHSLFVHSKAWSHDPDLMKFAALAPLVDVVVYVRQPLSVLIARTEKRGHNRIPGHSSDRVGFFVKQAVDIFEALHLCPVIADRLLVIEGEQNTLVAPSHYSNPLLMKAVKLIAAGIGEGQNHA